MADNNTNELAVVGASKDELSSIAEMIGQTFVVTGQQLIEYGKELSSVKADVGALRSELASMSAKSDNNERRIDDLEDKQYVNDRQYKSLLAIAQRRAAELLEIKFDDKHQVVEGIYEYTHYFGAFVQAIHRAARKEGIEGSNVRETPRKNYGPAIEFYNEWYPEAGVAGYKRYLDELAESKKK